MTYLFSEYVYFGRDLLKGGLSASNHHERFSLLLHCEEVQMHVDIRNYDMRGVMLTRCIENPRLLTLRVRVNY